MDPLDSTSRILAPEIVGKEHYEIARAVQQVLQRYKELQDIIAIMGMDELSEEDKRRLTVHEKYSVICRRASRLQNSLPEWRELMYR